MLKSSFFKLEALDFGVLFCFAFFAIPFLLGSELAYGQASSPEEKKIEEMMMIHYLNPQMKSDYDRVAVSGDKAKISLWRDLPPNPDPERIQCLGYEWLLTGRGEKMGRGAYEVFKSFPELNEISLQFVDLKFKVESKDHKGKFTRKEEARVYLKVSVLRSEIEKYKIDNQELRSRLQSNLKTCLGIGQRLKISTELHL